MTSAIVSVVKSSSFERRLSIAHDANERQDSIIESFERDGFEPDWQAIIADIGQPADPLESIERRLTREFRRPEFTDSIAALGVNGSLLAAWTQRRHEMEIGVRMEPLIIGFKEADVPNVFEPQRAVAYWQKILNLSDERAAELLDNLTGFQNEALAIRGRVTDAVMKKLGAIFEETIAKGLSFEEFVSRIVDLPASPKGYTSVQNFTRYQLRAEYRTRLTQSYGGARHEQILERANVFPFIQFHIIRDSRTTWWICLPMGTAGPGGKGYIAASDDAVWFTWRPPNHFGGCRSTITPIGYREAQRMKILAADGRTKLAVVGSNPDRPFGDPPLWATDPISGAIRRVEPQLGFGAA